MSETNPEVSFSIEKLYVKDVSFESPQAPGIFMADARPDLNVEVEISHQKIDADKGMYEVVINTSISAKQDDKSIFLAEVQQAGLFHVSGVPDEHLPVVLEINCPNILLPYARETLSTLIGKGGFPPVLISPVNFEYLYAQRHGGSQTAN